MNYAGVVADLGADIARVRNYNNILPGFVLVLTYEITSQRRSYTRDDPGLSHGN